MDLVAAALLIFPLVCTDASLLSYCFAHVTEMLLCCSAFASLDQSKKQLFRIFGPELIRINSLIKTARSGVLKNRAEHGFFVAASAAKFSQNFAEILI